MSVSTNREGPPRVPQDVGGIQVNFCKNPGCPNFGVPASTEKQPRGPGAEERGRDHYRVAGSTHGRERISVPVISCLLCNEAPPIKSNQGVNEERTRMAAYLAAPEPSCSGESCPNHGVGVNLGKGRYHRKGVTAAGSPRWVCLLSQYQQARQEPPSAPQELRGLRSVGQRRGYAAHLQDCPDQPEDPLR